MTKIHSWISWTYIYYISMLWHLRLSWKKRERVELVSENRPTCVCGLGHVTDPTLHREKKTHLWLKDTGCDVGSPSWPVSCQNSSSDSFQCMAWSLGGEQGRRTRPERGWGTCVRKHQSYSTASSMPKFFLARLSFVVMSMSIQVWPLNAAALGRVDSYHLIPRLQVPEQVGKWP